LDVRAHLTESASDYSSVETWSFALTFQHKSQDVGFYIKSDVRFNLITRSNVIDIKGNNVAVGMRIDDREIIRQTDEVGQAALELGITKETSLLAFAKFDNVGVRHATSSENQ
jgi:hypothetical protein